MSVKCYEKLTFSERNEFIGFLGSRIGSNLFKITDLEEEINVDNTVQIAFLKLKNTINHKAIKEITNYLKEK